MKLAKRILEFPKLGLKIPLERVAFTIFGRPVNWYAVIIGTGILICAYLAYKRGPKFGVHSEDMFDIIFWAFIVGVIGAKVYYVAFAWDEYRDDWKSIFRFEDGGMAIYGGVIGGALAIFIYTKIKKIRFVPPLDTVASVMLLGHAIGRWGNFVNIEAYGTNTTMPWGMTSENIVRELTQLKASGVDVDPNMPVHPCFLYESVWCFIGFFVISNLMKKRKFDGEIIAAYLAWYGFGRFFIEGLRTDSLYIGSVRVSQLLALLLFLVSITFIIVARIQLRKANVNITLYVDTIESKKRIAKVDEKLYADKEKSRKKKEARKVKKETKETSEKENKLDDEKVISEDAEELVRTSTSENK